MKQLMLLLLISVSSLYGMDAPLTDHTFGVKNVWQPSSESALRDFMNKAHEEALGEVSGYHYPSPEPTTVKPPKPPMSSDDHEGTSHWVGRQTTKVTHGIKSALFGNEIKPTPRRVLSPARLDELKNSNIKAERKRYCQEILKDNSVRQSVDKIYYPFSKVISDAGIHEYKNTNIKRFLFEIRDSKDKQELFLELALTNPRLIVDKQYETEDYHDMLNDYIHVKEHVYDHSTYSEPSTVIYTHEDAPHDPCGFNFDKLSDPFGYDDGTYLDMVPTLQEDILDFEQNYSLKDLAIDKILDEGLVITNPLKREISEELTRKYLLDTVVTHAEDRAFNPDQGDWDKDSRKIDKLLSNLSHITDEHLENFDPVTRGLILGIADVAEDKYALGKLMSPAGKGLVGGSMKIAREVAVGSGEKVSFVTRTIELLTDDNFDKHLALSMYDQDTFKDLMDKDNAKVKKLFNPSNESLENIKNQGVSKTVENAIRYTVREYLNAKIHPNYTGTIKNNLKKSVTYGRALGQISKGGGASTGVRLAKGVLRRTNDTIIKNTANGNLSKAIGAVRNVKDIVDTAHAAGLLPKASDYDD